MQPGLPAETAAQYERTWWPVKITDSQLPHFAVPIQPRWSAGLFGIPQTLPTRASVLALGGEQVYYRSGWPSALRAPGRILWYLSQSPQTGPGRFIGTSLLDAIDTDTPEALHTAFQHYGVFQLDDIREVAGTRGVAQALRLSDMELFDRPVTWRNYQDIQRNSGGPRSIQGPATMEIDTFVEVYRQGTSR